MIIDVIIIIITNLIMITINRIIAGAQPHLQERQYYAMEQLLSVIDMVEVTFDDDDDYHHDFDNDDDDDLAMEQLLQVIDMIEVTMIIDIITFTIIVIINIIIIMSCCPSRFS